MTARLWILGAPDPEMEAIETLLIECGECVAYAALCHASDPPTRVRPGHRAETAIPCPRSRMFKGDGGDGSTIDLYLVECDLPPGMEIARSVTRMDHHTPGDPGYGRPVEEFLSASSVGQVISELERIGVYRPVSVPRQLVLTAAADHCLGAAYRGQCPGIDPDELMRWRAESRAAFQQRPVAEVLADIERAKETVLSAPYVTVREADAYDVYGQLADWSGYPPVAWGDALTVRDLRGAGRVDARGGGVPELPEAALRLGEGYLAGPLETPDGRHKLVCSGTAEQVRAFIEHWAPSQGLVDLYGDPMRGFAGGYLARRTD